MATQVQRRKGTTVQHSTFTGASAELTVDTTKNTVVVHDGATAGGIPLAKESGSALSPSSLSLPNGTANAVPYLNGSKVLTSGSALTFDGAALSTSSGTGAVTFIAGSSVSGSQVNIGVGVVTAGRPFIGTNTDSNPLEFGTRSGTDIIFLTSTTERMRLTSTGLGIGTSSPARKLEVVTSASGNIAGFTTTAGGGQGILLAVDTTAKLTQFKNNTDADYGMAFYTNATERMRLDSSGNLGLGVTPSAWSTWRALDINSNGAIASASSSLTVGTNHFWNGSNWIYKSTGANASRIGIGNGSFQFFTAPSGTAGNAISFTQAMTLDASGRFMVGMTNFTGSLANGTGFGVLPSGYGQLIRNQGPSLTVARTVSTGVIVSIAYGSTDTNAAEVGSISYNGSVVLYNTTSDQRLKENIQDAEPASALIDSLQVRQYDWKSSGNHQRYGFIAQELVTVAPEAVHQPADPEEMMAVDYSKLVPMMVKEIQDLRKRLAAAGIA